MKQEGTGSGRITVTKHEELEDLRTKDQYTIAEVSEEGNKPYILLEDADGEKYWRPYGGEPLDLVKKWNTWEVEAQKKLKDKSRSSEELADLRSIVMAVQVFAEFFEFTPMDVQDTLVDMIGKIGENWAIKDGISEKDMEKEDIIAPYFSLALYYVRSFMYTMDAISHSKVASAMEAKSFKATLNAIADLPSNAK